MAVAHDILGGIPGGSLDTAKNDENHLKRWFQMKRILATLSKLGSIRATSKQLKIPYSTVKDVVKGYSQELADSIS